MTMPTVIWNDWVASCFRNYPLFVHHQRCETPRVTKLHKQPGIEMHFTHAGRGSFHLPNEVLLQQGRGLVVLNGLVAHQVFADVQSRYTRTVICIDQPLLDLLTLTYGPELGRILPGEGAYNVTLSCEAWQEAEYHLNAMFMEWRLRRPGWQQSSLGHLLNLFVQLQRVERQGCNAESGNQENDLLRRCLQLIETQLDTDLTVKGLAKVLAVSPKYLSSLFSRTMGSGISAYIWSRRVAIAQRLLATERHLSIAGVAARCGFKTQAHFSRRFAAATGVTPSDFRANMSLNRPV